MCFWANGKARQWIYAYMRENQSNASTVSSPQQQIKTKCVNLLIMMKIEKRKE